MSSSSRGWYGKLPVLGDFISKALPETFVKPWDQWLQEGMISGRETYEDTWEEQYLTFPMWRFLWQDKAHSDELWAGILMPSLDRVGRLFPFTIATSLGHYSHPPPLARLDRFLAQCQGLAEKLLEDDALDLFETALFDLETPQASPSGPLDILEQATPPMSLLDLEASHRTLAISMDNGLEGTLAHLAMNELFSRSSSPNLWWQAATADQDGIVLTSNAGLTAALFLDLVRSTS